MDTLILAINGGSSSLKYGAFAMVDDRAEPVISGAVKASSGHVTIFDEIALKLGGARPDAIGHRIVHGGPILFQPTLIDADVVGKLEAASAFAPLHGPATLDLIATAQRYYPDTPQIACFDTGFHQHLPPVLPSCPYPRHSGRPVSGATAFTACPVSLS